MFRVPEHFRVKEGKLASTKENGNNGLFKIHLPTKNCNAFCLVSDNGGWEQVSVRVEDLNKQLKGGSRIRIPNSEELKFLKNVFWDRDETVIQYHFADSKETGSEYALHLFRHKTRCFPEPPSFLFGDTSAGNTKEPNTIINDLINHLKSDPELYQGYKDNIAMSFKDSYGQFRRRTQKRTLSHEDVHNIANEAADNFLQLLINVDQNARN